MARSEGADVDAPVVERAVRGHAVLHATAQLSVAERVGRGRAARSAVPRTTHEFWEAPPQRSDAPALLRAQDATRDAERVAARHARMAESPFAFLRGAAAVMAADLSATPQSGLPVQMYGDAHLANFGGFSAPERDLVFDAVDFDETLPGPWEWDVKRLGASIAVAGRGRGYSLRERSAIVTVAVREYRRTMDQLAGMGNLEVWSSRLDAADVIRRYGHTIDRRTLRRFDAVQPHPREVPLAEGEAAAVEETVKAVLRAYRRSLQGDRRLLLESYRYVHLARAIDAGDGSRAWVALLLGRDDGDALLLQLKPATEAVAERFVGASRFATHGQRVVEGQRVLQGVGDVFLGWCRVPAAGGGDSDWYGRQSWEWKIAPTIDTMRPADMAVYARMCAWTLARGHARSGDRVAIAAYLGSSDVFDRAVARFAELYADQTEKDHAAFAAVSASPASV